MPVDILLNDSFDALITGGDFVSGESTRQHQKLLLLVERGEVREFPTRGVGLQSWLNDDTSGNLNAAIKREYEIDGMKVIGVKGSATNLQVEAVYE